MNRLHDTNTPSGCVPTAFGAGINNTVRRISLEYTDRAQLGKVSSYTNATTGSGTIVNQVALSYNAFNQLIEDAQSHSGAVSGSTPKVGYSYANGTANTTRRLTSTYPSGKIITMSYGSANSADDRLSRLAGLSLTGEAAPLGQFAWMGSGRLVTLIMPQPGIGLSYKHVTGEPVGDAGDPYSGYDRFGRTVDMRWIKTSDQSSLSRIQYGYDKMSRRLWRQDLAAPADTQQDRFYGYDGLGQVTDSALGNLNINRTSIAGIPAQREAFDYDSIGNWKQYLRQANGDTTLDQKRTSNRDNQLTELDANSDGLAYDAAGNMTACRPDKDGDWSKGYTIVWDAWNRIVQVKNAQTAATVATYAYDGLTRRTTSTVSGTVRHFYYNSSWKCVEERTDTSTNPDRVYYWSTRPGHRDELLRRDRATSGGALNETLWCLMDYFDPIAITDGNGVIQERCSYSTFGLANHITPAFAPKTSSSFDWNFLFHGQFRDTETGWDNYGYRYYLPSLGRWLSRDPIGESAGINLFAMINNLISNGVDYFGLAGGKENIIPTELERMTTQAEVDEYLKNKYPDNPSKRKDLCKKWQKGKGIRPNHINKAGAGKPSPKGRPKGGGGAKGFMIGVIAWMLGEGISDAAEDSDGESDACGFAQCVETKTGSGCWDCDCPDGFNYMGDYSFRVKSKEKPNPICSPDDDFEPSNPD